MRASDHIAKPSSSVLLLAAVAMLSLWPSLLAIAEEGTPPAEALAEGDAVAEGSTAAVADSAAADGNTVDGDLASDADDDVSDAASLREFSQTWPESLSAWLEEGVLYEESLSAICVEFHGCASAPPPRRRR